MMENNESNIMMKNGLDLNEVPVDMHFKRYDMIDKWIADNNENQLHAIICIAFGF